MSQNVFNEIDPFDTNGEELAVILKNFKDAIMSGLIGATRPTQTTPGGMWVDNSLEAAPNYKWTLKIWTGSIEIPIVDININSGTLTVLATGETLTQQDIVGGVTINNLSTATRVARITGTGDTVINGINPSGATGALIIHNASTKSVTLNSESVSASSVQARMSLPSSIFVLSPGASVELFNDTTANRWKMRDEGDLQYRVSQTTSTGVWKGMAVTVNADPTKFDIGPGLYDVADLSDMEAPKIYRIKFAGVTGVNVINLLSQPVTYISIDKDQVITQASNFPTATGRRNAAFLARLNHSDNIQISFVNNFPDYKGALSSSLYDLMDAIAPFIISGLTVTQNGANLKFNTAAGSVFFRSANFVSDPTNPHRLDFAAQAPAAFRKVTRSSTTDLVDVNDIDPANYDNAGVVTAIGGGSGTSSIQRVYKYKSGAVRVQYGPTTYSNLAAALEAVATESFVVNPSVEQTAVLIATIVISKGCTSLLDTNTCRIIPAGRFGGSGGGSGGGGGVPTTTTANRLYGTDSGGNQALIPYTSAATADNAALRTAEAQVLAATVADGDGAATTEDLLNRGYLAAKGFLRKAGTYNASTNSPDLDQAATRIKGDYYLVSASGVHTFTGFGGAISLLSGDWVLFNGTTWEKVDFNQAVPSMTTAVRDSLTFVTGRLIHNSTTGNLEYYSGSEWIPVGGGVNNVTTITASETLNKIYDLVIVDASAGNINITLPAAVAKEIHQFIRIDAVSTNTVTITRAGTNKILSLEGEQNTYTLPFQGSTAKLVGLNSTTWGVL